MRSGTPAAAVRSHHAGTGCADAARTATSVVLCTRRLSCRATSPAPRAPSPSRGRVQWSIASAGPAMERRPSQPARAAMQQVPSSPRCGTSRSLRRRRRLRLQLRIQRSCSQRASNHGRLVQRMRRGRQYQWSLQQPRLLICLAAGTRWWAQLPQCSSQRAGRHPRRARPGSSRCSSRSRLQLGRQRHCRPCRPQWSITRPCSPTRTHSSRCLRACWRARIGREGHWEAAQPLLPTVAQPPRPDC